MVNVTLKTEKQEDVRELLKEDVFFRNEERLAPVLVSREFVLRLGAHDRQPLIALVQASITEWNEHFIRRWILGL